MNETEKNRQALDTLKNKICKSPNAENWYIDRIPKDLKRFIIDFANKNCCGDYGWALSLLLGPVDDNLSEIRSLLTGHERRIIVLEAKDEEPEPKLKGRARFKEEKKNVSRTD